MLVKAQITNCLALIRWCKKWMLTLKLFIIIKDSLILTTCPNAIKWSIMLFCLIGFIFKFKTNKNEKCSQI